MTVLVPGRQIKGMGPTTLSRLSRKSETTESRIGIRL